MTQEDDVLLRKGGQISDPLDCLTHIQMNAGRSAVYLWWGSVLWRSTPCPVLSGPVG